MNVADVMKEWLVGFTSEDMEFEGLAYQEPSKISSSLTTTVWRRRQIARYVQSLVSQGEIGTMERACEIVENRRLSLGKRGRPCSLNFLVDVITGKKQ